MKPVTTIRTLLLAGAALAAAACASSDRLASPSAALEPDTATAGGDTVSYSLLGLPLNLLSCSALPADSASADIGAAGGMITVGPHTLVIPAGALDSTVTITARITGEAGNQVDFGPHGLRFASSATLTMSYANCDGALLLLPRAVVYTSDLLAILDILPTANAFGAEKVRAHIGHFSGYAVAW